MVEITPLGHATVLIEVAGFRLITDPVLGDAVGLSVGQRVLGPRRLRPPPLRARELPPVDAVLLSHSHWDHTDRATLRALPRDAAAVTQKGNLDLVRRFPNRTALSWGEALSLDEGNGLGVRVTSVRARHWGARMVVDRWRGFGGYLIEIDAIPSPDDPARPLAILFAGDTAVTSAYRSLRESRGGRGVDVAIMPIGAYNPWIMNHCNPEQAWAMAIHDLRATRLLPIHYDTFRLSAEPLGEPLSRLRAAAAADGEEERLTGLELGSAIPDLLILDMRLAYPQHPP